MKPRFNYRIPLAVSLISITGMVGLFIKAHAQTGSPAQWSTTYTSGPIASCPTPAAGTIIHCAVTNVGVEESVNGSAYVPVNQPGIQGAQGPAGQTGATGAMGATGLQGPPGPVQSFNTNSCKTVNGSSSGWVETGCTQTNP